MKRTDFSKPAHYEFVNLLLEAEGHKGSVHLSRIYSDFLILASCSIRQASEKVLTGSISPEVEAEYMKTVKRYPEPKKFAEALAVMVNALEETCYDFLGCVYMESEQGNKNTGQFFTPRSLSDAIAAMTFNFTKEEFTSRYPVYGCDRERFTFSDPCIGGGSMLIALVKRLKEIDAHPRQWWFEAGDIDSMCAQMAYIQLSLLGAPGVVYLGNALGDKAGHDNPPWFTTTGALFPLTERQRNGKPSEVKIEIVSNPRKKFKLPLRKH